MVLVTRQAPDFTAAAVLGNGEIDALRDSWQDLDTHYDRLERQFWRFYPQMMTQAENREL